MMNATFKSGIAALILMVGSAFSAFAQTPTQLQAFPTAEAAADALTEALRKSDDKAIATILGSDWRALVPSSTDDYDRARARFVAAWDESHKVRPDGDDKALIEVGKTNWVAPFPIVKQNGQWRYDVEAGRQEIQARTIGRNELSTVQTLLAIVDAQIDYASADPMKTGGNFYARRLLSSPGKKDGLYWEAKPGEPQSPLGPLVAKAQGGDVQGGSYHGYYYRLLYRQGAAAPGGAYDYLVGDKMLAGFAVVAWPVRYGDTGVMTFMVSLAGDVYERDFGQDTPTKAAELSTFNPDGKWQKADMSPP